MTAFTQLQFLSATNTIDHRCDCFDFSNIPASVKKMNVYTPHLKQPYVL